MNTSTPQIFIYTVSFINPAWVKMEVPASVTECILQNCGINENTYKDYLKLVKEIDNEIIKIGINAWTTTWAFGSMKQNIIAIKVIEKDLNSLVKIIKKTWIST